MNSDDLIILAPDTPTPPADLEAAFAAYVAKVGKHGEDETDGNEEMEDDEDLESGIGVALSDGRTILIKYSAAVRAFWGDSPEVPTIRDRILRAWRPMDETEETWLARIILELLSEIYLLKRGLTRPDAYYSPPAKDPAGEAAGSAG